MSSILVSLRHAQNILSIPGASISKLHDVHFNSDAEIFQEENGLSSTSDPEDLVNNSDAIIIATTSSTHFEVKKIDFIFPSKDSPPNVFF